MADRLNPWLQWSLWQASKHVQQVNPTSGDDRLLKDALQQLIGDGDQLTPQELILIRRLWFESYTLTVTEIQNKMQKNPSDTPKTIPLAERLARVEEQRERLKGLIYDQFLEPAHALTDKIQAMLEHGVVTYLAPEKCISQHDEIQCTKSDQQLSFDAQGNVKVTKADSQLSCDVTELMVQTGSIELQNTCYSKLFFWVSGYHWKIQSARGYGPFWPCW